MKKAISLFLTLALCLSLCACGGNEAESSATPATQDSNTGIDIPTESIKTDEYTQLGQDIDVGFASISFSAPKITYTIGETISVNAPDGMRYFGLVGTIKNTGGQELAVNTVRAEMVFNDEFTYSASATIGGKRNTTKVSVAPLAEAEYWIYAEIPEALLEQLSTCEVRFSFNEGFSTLPESVEKGDYTIRILLDEDTCNATLDALYTATEFFAECPILPTPKNYSPVWQTSSSSNSFNGKVTSIKYSYSVSPGRSDDLKEIYSTYISNLEKTGFTIQTDSDNSCTIYSDTTKLATISVDSSRISFDIVPGNENLTAAPSSSDVDTAEILGGDTIVKIGDSIETSYFSMNFEKYDSDLEIRSGTSQYGRYTYYTSENGDPYFFVYGTLKNLGGTPVDIRNIYVQFCFDGKYNYKGSVDGVVSSSDGFINDVSPLASVNYYMYTAVPQELIDSYTTCSVRIGFTENFDYKVVDVNDLPKFENCDDIFCLEIVKE